MSEYTMAEMNKVDTGAFVEGLGDVYERSPWVAERVATDRPFASIDELHQRMVRAVRDASRERQLELLRAHPDLGDQTKITDASEEEQASAGLDNLSQAQYETLQRLNETYRDRFEFPFIMAVKGSSPDEIQTAMQERIENEADDEFRTALAEVHEIARLRLRDRVTD